MNILFFKYFCVGFMVSDIPRVSVFDHCPYSFTFSYIYYILHSISIIISNSKGLF